MKDDQRLEEIFSKVVIRVNNANFSLETLKHVLWILAISWFLPI